MTAAPDHTSSSGHRLKATWDWAIANADVDERLDDLGTAIRELDQTVSALQAGGQYHVLEHDATWDIASDDGRVAYADRHKQIKIDQDDVLAVLDYASRTGEQEVEYSVDGRNVPLDKVIELDTRGTRYALVPLGRMYARGEDLDFVVKRTLNDVLCDPVNSVTARTEDVTALLRMTVIWPAGKGPSALRLSQTAEASTITQSLPLTLVQEEAGRPTLHFNVPQPERGGRTEISWDWPHAA
jgi:hypothetical protein